MGAVTEAVENYRACSRESYGLGLDAGLETSRLYQRRGDTVENFILTVLGGTYPAFSIQNRLKTRSFVDHLQLRVYKATERDAPAKELVEA